MAGLDFVLVLQVCFFIFMVWGFGRAFQHFHAPEILGQLAAGIILGPQLLDMVAYASDGMCSTSVRDDPYQDYINGPNYDDGCDDSSGGSGWSNSTGPGRMLAGGSGQHDCTHFTWNRWENDGHIISIWQFLGNIGVTLMIFESGMHIDFAKVQIIGRKAFVIAVFGTALPLISGMILVGLLFEGDFYPSGFAAGCAFAPTSVGISIKLLEQSKMLHTIAGQTTLTAAFIDDIFSLVTLVIMQSLAEGNLTIASVVVPPIASFAFLGFAVYLSIYVFSRLDKQLHRIRPQPNASIPPRDEVHLSIMMFTLILFAYLSSIKGFIGSHLLGAFAAGMCFVNVPRSHFVWNAQMKRLVRWMVRIFFAASVGFAVPVSDMFSVGAFWRGILLGIGPTIATKVLSGMFGRVTYPSEVARENALKAHWVCKYAQPQQLLVGMAMVARGEFAYLVADTAQSMDFMKPEVYASVVWALVMATIFSPVCFKWALGIFQLAEPMERSHAITIDASQLPPGAPEQTHEFVIRIAGRHHAGVQHDMLDALHHMGLDIFESEVHAFAEPGSEEVDAFVASYVVLPRGPKKDYDDEKLQQMRHHLQEVIDDREAQILFEPHNAHFGTDSAVEVAVLVEHHPHVLSEIASKLTALGLDVLKAELRSSKQAVKGVTTRSQDGTVQMTTMKKKNFAPETIIPGQETLFEAKTEMIKKTNSTFKILAEDSMNAGMVAGDTRLVAFASTDRQIYYAIEQAEHTHTIGAHRREEIKAVVEESIKAHQLQGRCNVRVCHKNEMMVETMGPNMRDVEGIAVVKYEGPHHKDILPLFAGILVHAHVNVVFAVVDSTGPACENGLEAISLYCRGEDKRFANMASLEQRQQLLAELSAVCEEKCDILIGRGATLSVAAMKKVRRFSADGSAGLSGNNTSRPVLASEPVGALPRISLPKVHFQGSVDDQGHQCTTGTTAARASERAERASRVSGGAAEPSESYGSFEVGVSRV